MSRSVKKGPLCQNSNLLTRIVTIQDSLRGVGTFEHDDYGGSSGKRLKFSQEVRGGGPEAPSDSVIYEHSQDSQHIQDNTTGGGNSITTDLAPVFSAGITADTVLLGGIGGK